MTKELLNVYKMVTEKVVCLSPLSLLMASTTSEAKIAQPLWGKAGGLKVSETLADSPRHSFCEDTIIIEQD